HRATLSRMKGTSDDQSFQLLLLPIEAKLRARRGEGSEARRLAEEAIRIGDATDGLNQIASTRLALAEVLHIGGLDVEADAAIEEAIELFERKANVVAVSQARELLALGTPAA